MKTTIERLKSGFFITLGFFFLVVGIIGIFLPLLPTTPFLLLAAICFNQGSPKFHSWLLNHKWFGPPIRDWNQNRAIKLQNKILATVMTVGSAYWVLPNERIPPVGKTAYFLTISATMLFVWTRNTSKR